MKSKELDFETKLELFIGYMNSFVLQIPIDVIYEVQLIPVDYTQFRQFFNNRLLNKNMKMFYKFYKECVCNYNENILNIFKDQLNIHTYNYYSIAIQMVQYMSTYKVEILDSFFKIVFHDN